MNTRKTPALNFRVRIARFLPSSRQGSRTLLINMLLLAFFAGGASISVQAAASNSIARVWNERALAAIRQDTPHPPGQARNYFSFSICMYDAWAAYDPVAVGYG